MATRNNGPELHGLPPNMRRTFPGRRIPMGHLRFRLICFVLLLSICAATLAYSQGETGQISGTVYDPSGAVVPNAKITVKSVATGAERQTTSSGAGTYTVTNLQPGTYTVKVEATGFAAFQQNT